MNVCPQPPLPSFCLLGKSYMCLLACLHTILIPQTTHGTPIKEACGLVNSNMNVSNGGGGIKTITHQADGGLFYAEPNPYERSPKLRCRPGAAAHIGVRVKSDKLTLARQRRLRER